MPLTIKTRYKKGRTSRINPDADHLVNLAVVAHRWSVTPENAKRRLERLGTTFVRFSKSSSQVWLSDLLAIEKRFSSTAAEGGLSHHSD
jgi:hypothetical protein